MDLLTESSRLLFAEEPTVPDLHAASVGAMRVGATLRKPASDTDLDELDV